MTCAAAGTAFRLWPKDPDAGVSRSFALPFSHSVGLVEHQGRLHSLDRKRLLLYSLDGETGKLLGLQKFTSTAPSGLARSEGSFWSANAEAGLILQHNIDSEFSVRKTLASKDRRPTALYWDGEHLWNADAQTETVYEYAGAGSLEPSRQFTLPGLAISGLHVADGVLWALDTVTRRLYRYRLKTLPVALDYLRLDDLLAATSQTTGMAVKGSTLWIITERPAELHRFDLSRVQWTPAARGAAPTAR